jgi:hypothetical protein
MLKLMKPTGISLLLCFLAVLCGYVTSPDVSAATVPVLHEEVQEKVLGEALKPASVREISTNGGIQVAGESDYRAVRQIPIPKQH